MVNFFSKRYTCNSESLRLCAAVRKIQLIFKLKKYIIEIEQLINNFVYMRIGGYHCENDFGPLKDKTCWRWQTNHHIASQTEKKTLR